jgi:hypothetical protein
MGDFNLVEEAMMYRIRLGCAAHAQTTNISPDQARRMMYIGT